MAEDAPAVSGPTRFARATEEMQQTTKWLMTVVAGFASAFIAGLRFSDAGHLRGVQLLITGLGVTLVLAAAVGVLGAAARVLATPYETLRGVVVATGRAERRGGGSRLGSDPRIDALNSQDDLIYRGRAESHDGLFRAFRAANAELFDATRSADPDLDVTRLEHEVDALAQAAERAADFLDYASTRERFKTLFVALAAALAAALVGIALFIYAQDHAPALITKPTAVTVVLSHPRPVRFGCRATELAGVAIAGDWQRPQVVLAGPPPCRPTRVTVTESMGVVVPKP